jgi:hypothetical protein
MAYDTQIKSDPSPMPLAPAILVLMHKRRRQAFITYSSNARGRAAVLASSIRHRDDASRNHLRDLPPGNVEDFALLAMHIGLDKKDADEKVERLQRKFERDGWKLFGGARSAMPKVTLNGKRMSIVDAMSEARTKENYQTVYRRIQRGWPVKEALGLVDRA